MRAKSGPGAHDLAPAVVAAPLLDSEQLIQLLWRVVSAGRDESPVASCHETPPGVLGHELTKLVEMLSAETGQYDLARFAPLAAGLVILNVADWLFAACASGVPQDECVGLFAQRGLGVPFLIAH